MNAVLSALDGRDRHVINLTYLVKLRWVAVAGQLLATIGAALVLDLQLPGFEMGLVIGVTTLSNVVLWLLTRRGQTGPSILGEWTVAAVMGLDVLLLTALLFAAGRASNPFSSLYFVHVALSAAILRPVWTWSLVALSLGCFGALYLVPAGPEIVGPEVAAVVGARREGNWIAFALAASVTAYFTSRVQSALQARERELRETRDREARSEKLASLGTLAAGAAHELSTPLSTIAVVAKELERQIAKGKPAAELVEDTQLIREQVARCREILSQMAAEAGHSLGELSERITAQALVERACQRLPVGHGPVAFAPPAALAALQLELPPNATAQALRGVIKNALDASPPDVSVEITLARVGRLLEIRVRDQGEGMAPEVHGRIGEPFFTTKEPGKGMGLGVFLARAVTDRNGGALHFTSAPGKGTTATMLLPVREPGA
jgi:two-component system sensor histidine kinase RegB